MSLLNFEISILTVRILRYFLILGLKNIIQNFNSTIELFEKSSEVTLA